MVWAWSHTAEGMQAVRDNIADQRHEWLRVVFAEQRAAKKDPDRGGWDSVAFNEKRYKRALKWADKNPELLVEAIQEWTEELATCDNGGFEAWCCPYGCHTVPFDRDDSEEDDDFDWVEAEEVGV